MMAAQTGIVIPYLRDWRIAAVLTQDQLAERSGVSRTTIARGERGEPVSIPAIQRLAQTLNVTAQTLVNRAPGKSKGGMMSTQPRQRKTIIYARATDHAEAARQLDVCRVYALRAGYHAGTIDQISDFQTGVGIQSLILQGVRERIRSGIVDALIAESPGLITHDPDELVEMGNECRAYGTELRFPTQGY